MKTVILILIVWLGILFDTTAAQYTPFQWINPSPQGNDLYDVTYANGQYVAVGNYGAIVDSTNGLNWQLQSSPTSQALNEVSSGNGIFLAAGANGVVLTSSNGANWTLQPPPTGNGFTAIGFGNSLFVLADSAGNMYASSNGTSWSVNPSGTSSNGISSIAYGNNVFVGTAANGTVSSPDGMHWTFTPALSNATTNITTVGCVVFENGSFLVSAGANVDQPYEYIGPVDLVLESANGVNWSILKSTDIIRSAVFGNGQFSGYDYVNDFVVSTNFINWTVAGAGLPPSPYVMNAQAFGEGIFVAVGAYGTITISSNLQKWSVVSPLWLNSWWPTPGTASALASSTNVIVAAGAWNNGGGYPYPTAFASTNGGVTWIQDSVSTNVDSINGVTSGNGIFVLVGGYFDPNPYDTEPPALLLTSSDGINWETRNSGVTAILNNVTYGGGEFVAVGASGTIISSPTGAAWTGRYSGASVSLSGAAYGKGQFIVVGNAGTILSSTDSASWQGQASTVTQNLNELAFGNSIFVAVGQSGTITTSLDGVNWTQQTSGTSANITTIIYNNGLFVAPTAASSPSVVLTSYDGIHWQSTTLASEYPLDAVCPVANGLLLAGTSFAILETGNLGTPVLQGLGLTPQGFSLEYSGPLAQSHHFQGSPDLITWTNISAFTNTQNPFPLQDPSALTHSNGFYRVIAP
ncbi:MAG TPA: hypothetical protein VGN61_14080 [Verrucomicrobiae bacterium]|jgi:hypothetical protein